MSARGSLSPFPPPLRGRVREGGGGLGPVRVDPSPQPSPARGEGADRPCDAHSDSNFKELMCVCIPAAHCARGLPVIFAPSKIRGRWECRMRAAPAISCANSANKAAHEHTGQRRTSDTPCAMALRLISCSPQSGRARCHCHRAGREPLRNLTPASGASGPHDFTVRSSCSRQSQLLRPPHPRPSL